MTEKIKNFQDLSLELTGEQINRKADLCSMPSLLYTRYSILYTVLLIGGDFMLNKILLRKIKFPLSLRGAFPHVIARERSDRSNLNNKGFSLIELMVAVVILSMAIIGIFRAYSVGFMGMADARDRTVATNYARGEMENLKNMSFDNLDIGEAIPFTIPAPTKFSGTKTIEKWNGNDDLKKITTTVSWNDRNGNPKPPVKLETLLYNND